MPLVLRKDTLTPLTYEQMDGNFEFITTEITQLQSGLGISPEYIRSLFSGGPGITYNSATGEIEFASGSSVVTSLNGQTGAVVITAADLDITTSVIAEGTNQYFTATRAWNAVNDKINVAPGLTKNYNVNGFTIAPRNFNIALVGDVVGSARVTELNDVVIDTSLFGITVDASNITVTEGVIVRSPPTVPGTRRFTGLDFDPADFLVTDTGAFAKVTSRQNNSAVIEIIGNAMSGAVFGDVTETESGISVTFDPENGSIRISPRDFTIRLTGAVTGEGTVSRLRDVTINTINSNGYIKGIDAYSDINKVNVEPLTEVQFDVNAFTIKAVNKRLFISPKNALSPQDVRDIIGKTVQGTEQDVDLSTITETGIIVTYDRNNNTLSVAPRNFTITLAGAVSGSATISRLQDVTLTTNNINNYISGLDVYSDVNKVNANKITEVQFGLNSFDITSVGPRAFIDIKNALSPQDVRDIIGNTVQGTEQDVDLSTLTETGIIVTYDRANNTLSVAPRNFTITLAGAVSGQATISRLQDVTITTNNINNYISGFDVYSDVNQINSLKITEIQFDANDFGISSVNNRAYLKIKNALNPQDVRDIIGNTIQGTEQDVDLSTLTETGIIVTYDRENNTLSVAPRNFTITLAGAISGSATISRLQDVTLTTNNINNYISGFDVYSDVNQVNSLKITEVQFNANDFDVNSVNNRAYLKIKNALNPQDVRDIIGNTIQGTEQDVDLSTLTETGIIVTYDRENNTLSVAPRNFTITLAGAVSGQATISRLQDVTITTNNINNYIAGLDVFSDVNQVNVSKVTEFSFNLNQFAVTANDNRANIELSGILNPQDIRDIIGDTISGTERDVDLSTLTETGIIVTYDRENNTLSVAPRNFTITIDGAVSGQATISRLRDVTLTTNNINNYISGLDVYSDVNKVNTNKITELSFDLNQFIVTASNNRTSISIGDILNPQDIRDIIGNTISGTERDVDLSTLTETGIIVTYDRENNTLSVAPRNFTITIDGAVSGSATITRLRDVTLTTNNVNNYISGLDVFSDVNQVNVNKITELSFSLSDFDVSSDNNRATLALKNILSPSDIRDIIGDTVTGTERDVDLSTITETGIIVTYDRENNTLSVAPRNFTITLAGAVSGSATISRLGDVTLTTNNVNNYISGLDVYSDVNKVNVNKINEISFNLDQFEVTASNNRTNISLSGILNSQDIRDIIGNTISGTERDVDLSTITETGIIVTYDRENNTLSVAPRNFTITLAGAISGSATISRLGDVTLTTNNVNNYIAGLDVYSDVNKVNVSKINEISFDINQFIVTADDNRTNISLSGILNSQDIRDIIGDTVSGTERDVDLSTITETGIIVTYDRNNNTLSVAPRNFTITIDGAVSGSATITRLRDVTLTTNNINNYISGLDVYSDVDKININKITELSFNLNQFEVTASNNRTNISLSGILNSQDIRDIIGNTISGTERDVDLSTITETGIIVTYDRENNTLSVAPRNFTITLAGAVSGSATISRLGDVTLTTNNVNDYISGLDVYSDVNQVNTNKITEFSFNLDQFEVTASNNRTNISLSGILNSQDIRDIIGNTISGTERDVDLSTITETGIIVTYDRENNTLSVAPRNFTITLAGAVSGSATISRLGDVTLTTNNINNYISGLDVYSDVNKVNVSKINEISFDINQFIVTADDNRTNISIGDILNPQDIRDIIGETITGTERDVDLSTITETGIIVTYDRDNNTLSVAPRNFTITLAGAVSGSATISRLGDVTLTTNNINNYISGLDVYSDVNKVNVAKVTEFGFDPAQFDIISANQRVLVGIKSGLTSQDVRDIIGNTIQGTEQDVDLSTLTETGIIVTYDRENNTLSVAPRNFTITLAGAVSGSATISRLGDVTLTTNNVNNYISGFDVYSDVNKVNVNKITELSFDLNQFIVTANDNRTNISIGDILNPQDIRDIIGNTISGTERDVDLSTITETGIIVTYDRNNNTLSVAPRNFTITLAGAVSGSATISRLGDVTLTTNNINNYISGLDVYSDVNQVNIEKITNLKFNLNDFIVQASQNQATLSLKNILSPSDVRDIIGNTILGTENDADLSSLTETGIIVSYNTDNQSLSIAPRNFTITLEGAITGSATIRKLRDVVLTTYNTNNYIAGLDLFEGSNKSNVSKITELEFDQVNFDVNATNQRTVVTLKNQLSTTDIRNIIGQTVTGTEMSADLSTLTETGIIVSYSKANGTLSIAPKNFTINLTGAVTGSTTITRLGDATINVINSNNYISGLDIYDGVDKKNITPIKSVVFDSAQFNITTDGTSANVQFNNPIDSQAVRDIIGTTVLGESRDPVTGRVSETGIIITYDSDNNTLSVAPQDFSITLIGDVTGTTTISKLRSGTIQTTTTAIKGLGISKNSVAFDSGVKNLNFSSNFILTRDASTNTLAVDISNLLNTNQVLSIVGDALTGSQNGIAVGYNSNERQFSYNLANLEVNLQGAVNGAATLQYSGTGTQTLNIVTEIGEIGSGLAVKDEGETKGTSVTAINFVGGGVTSAVSMDGTIATVSIPNSPANEKFLLIDNGSANVPNARRLVAGTGIVLSDSGAGDDFVISASGGEVLGKVQITYDGDIVDEVPTVNFIDSQQVFFEVTSDGSTNKVDVTAYSLLNGWFRKTQINNGTLTDKYGNSLDMGPIIGGIIENQINLGDMA